MLGFRHASDNPGACAERRDPICFRPHPGRSTGSTLVIFQADYQTFAGLAQISGLEAFLCHILYDSKQNIFGFMCVE